MHNNQSFPAYSSSSDSSSSLANGKLHGQTYDYYDNTSAGLLENDHYSRNSHYQQPTTKTKSRTSLANKNAYENKDDEYNHYSHHHHHHNMDEEPYMNDDEEITNMNTLRKSAIAKQRVVVNNKHYTLDNEDRIG